MLIRLIFLFLLCLFSHSASATEESCYTSIPVGRTMQLWGVETKCKCGRALKKLELDTSGKLPIVAVCGYGYKQGDSKFDGLYIFQGDVSISGTVIVVADNEYPEQRRTFFFGDKLAENIWSSFINNSVTFDNYGEHEELSRPVTSKKNPCWIAKATIRFWQITVLMDDTDSAGSTPDSWEVKKLGKYKACTTADHAKFNI